MTWNPGTTHGARHGGRGSLMGGLSISLVRRAAGRGALSLAVAALVVVGSAAPAAAAPTASISAATVTAGNEVTISGTGWFPSCGINFAITAPQEIRPFGQLVEQPAPDGSFSVALTLPPDLAPGEYVMEVIVLAGCAEVPAGVPLPLFVEVPFTIVAAEPPPAEQPPEEQPPVVSPSPPTPAPPASPPTPASPVETQVGGATESSTAAGDSSGELPRTGSWSGILVGIGALLVLAGGLLVELARGQRRGTVRRKLTLVRVVALVMSAMLLVAACGDGDDNGDDASDEATEEPAGDGGEDIDVEGLDYPAAVFTIDDFEGFVPGEYVPGDEASLADVPIHPDLCAESVADSEAVTGYALNFEDAGNTMSFTAAVLAFTTKQEAEEAFESARTVAESCEAYVSQSTGNSFTREAPPGISESGEESFDLFARSDGGLLVGDHVVRDGQFVFRVRVILEQNSAFSAETLATMAEEAQNKFIDWVDEQAGG